MAAVVVVVVEAVDGWLVNRQHTTLAALLPQVSHVMAVYPHPHLCPHPLLVVAVVVVVVAVVMVMVMTPLVLTWMVRPLAPDEDLELPVMMPPSLEWLSGPPSRGPGMTRIPSVTPPQVSTRQGSPSGSPS